ncbi:MAG TPA: DsbA family protein [Gemmatimonadaceae bacterium]|nr:DsbA family protein [Gemmatimonadaceae bacterium]
MSKSSGKQGKGSPGGSGSASTRSGSRPAVQPRSKGPFYALLGVIAGAAVLLIAWQAMRPTSSGVVMIDPNTPLPEAEGYLLGDSAAPVQVLEWADFECPACGSFATLTEPDVRRRLVQTGQISFRFLDYPLPQHLNSWDASMAAACANEQGKFWEMHDQIFANQDRWATQVTNRPKAVLTRLAQSVGLDMSQWDDCYDSQKYKLNIRANQVEGETRGVRSTPTFIIGSRMIANVLGYDQFKMYVDSALAMAPAGEARPGVGGDTAATRAVPPRSGDR